MSILPARPVGLAYLLVVALLSACGTGPDLTASQYIAHAKSYQEKGELRAAVIELKNALQKAPNSIEARRLLGRLYVRVGHGPAAEKELRRALKLGLAPEAVAISLTRAALLQGEYQNAADTSINLSKIPKNEQAELLALWGHAYLFQEKIEKAKKAYNAALSINPEAPEALLGKARIAAAQSRFDESRQWLNKVFKTNPHFAPAWSLLGDLERYLGNAKEAEQAYGKAIAHQFNHADDLLNRALVRIYLEDYDGATADLKVLKQRVSNHPGVAYAQGLLDFQQKKYAEAQINFGKAIRYHPDYMPAVFYLGLSHYRQGHLEQAEQYLAKFLAHFPQSEAATRLLGAVRLSKGDYKGAKSALKPVLTRNPNDIRVLSLMGNIALRQGNAEEGIGYFQQVILQNPESAAAFMKLGLGLELSGKHEQSLRMLEKALELDPTLPQAELAVILSHLRAREFDQAIKAAQRMQEKYPDSPDPLTLMGGAYLGKGEEAKAREAFSQALKVAPGDHSATYNLANLAIKNGHLEKAISLYRQAAAQHPGHLATLLRLAELEQRRGNVAEAKKLIEQAMEKNPQAVKPRILLGNYYLRQGQPQRVLALTREIRHSHSDVPALVALTGLAQLALKEPYNAAKTFEELVKLQPKSANAHYQLAKAYSAMNQPSKAREALDKTLTLDPNHAGALFIRIHLLMSQGEQEKANEYLQELKKIRPHHPEVMDLKAKLALQQNHPQQAVEIYQTARQRFPESNRWPLRLAQVQWQLGHQEVGTAILKEWLKSHPEDFEVQFVVANYYLLQSQNNHAKIAFTKLHQIAPDNALVLNNLAWLMRKEDPEKALNYAKRALEKAPGSPETMDTLGIILREQDRIPEAMQWFKKAADKSPQNPNFQFHLAETLAQKGETAQAREILQDLLPTDRPFPEIEKAQALLKQLEE